VATILYKESVDVDSIETLDNYVDATYPDLRKCLRLLQANSTSGKLEKPGNNDKAIRDWKLDVVEMMKAGKIREARTVICNQATVEEIDEIFRWMYDNLDLWSKNMQAQDEAILIIRKGMVNHSQVTDPEINLSATLVELTQIEQ
jgi:hypothetical protein